MNQSIGLVAIVIHDYDEAIHFYVEMLGFRLIEDTHIPVFVREPKEERYGTPGFRISMRTAGICSNPGPSRDEHRTRSLREATRPGLFLDGR